MTREEHLERRRAEYRQNRPRYLAYMKEYQKRKPEVNREASRRYRAANPKKRRDTILRYRYKLTAAEFDAMAERQDRRCAVCGDVASRLYVDHDHKCCATTPTCGACTRGLVCNGCNTYDRMSDPWVDKMGRARGRAASVGGLS